MQHYGTSVKLIGFPGEVMDPAAYPEAIGKANTYRCPVGPTAGRAYALAKASTLTQIRLEETISVQLEAGSQQLEIPFLYLVAAHCVSGGHHTDGTARVYLLELADCRYILERFSSCNKQFNVRCPDAGGTGATDPFYADSLNSGSLYTWQTVVNVLWGLLPSTLVGAAPTLPYTPDGQPEQLRFIGVSAWQAVNDVLAAISCICVYNPLTNVFSIQKLGAEQTGFTAAKNNNTRYLDNADPVEGTYATIPETIRVFFNRQYVHFGCEPETQRTTGSWSTTAVHSIDVATGRSGVIAGSVLNLWDDLPALTNFDGSLSNSTALSNRATARKTEWLAAYDQGQRQRYIYSGLIGDFLPGSQVKEVIWGNSGFERDYTSGAHTEVIVHRQVPKAGGAAGGLSVIQENWAPPDLARRSFPEHPRLLQIVKVYVAARTTAGLFEGKLIRFDATQAHTTEAALIEGEDIWIRVPDTTVTTLTEGDYFLGRISGTVNDGGDKRPVYVIRHDSSSATISYAALESSTDVAFSYTASAVTKIPFSVERVDFDSQANDANDRLIAGTTGRYAMHFCGIARLASPVSDTAGPELFIRFRKNGAGSIVHSSVKLPSIGGVAVSQQVTAQWMLELDATDYIEVFAECAEDVEFARIFFHMWYLGPIP